MNDKKRRKLDLDDNHQQSFIAWSARLLVLFAALLLATELFADTVANNISRSYPEYPPAHIEAGADKAQIARGEYLVKLGDCMACHTDTANRGAPFAGGLRIDTPFGALFAPNITPDKTTGIGNWSEEDFVTAVREGISPDGSYYFPVFPYNYFNKMSREDVAAIKAYLDRIPAVKNTNKPAQMEWPFNYRWLQFGWRLLYFDFDKGQYSPDPKKSERWNRGAYIVEGPGHCALCHTELNTLGVPKKAYYLAGAFVQDYYAPNISEQGLQHLPLTAVTNIFMRDVKPTGGALLGPMSDVEHNSLRYLRHEDMLAIADYLKMVKSRSPPVEDLQTPLKMDAGLKLYESNCDACHNTGILGAPQVNKQRVRQILRDQGRDYLYQIAIKGDGPMPPKGACNICSDARVEAAVDHMIKLESGDKLDGR
ncbi:MAG TPA: cytochrome c5 family protein [Betaproteobacteria bacterium]|nr:cytochrome c5 family protein [Betaproteobacteria bacterium]